MMTDPLPLRKFGQTNLSVTPLCVGCSGLSSMPDVFGYEVSEEQALATLRAAFQSPIKYLDTAAGYGDGESERRIGIVLRELGGLPDGYVLATKVDCDAVTGDFSGEQTRRSVERSLSLLGLDRLQIVFLHDPESTTFEDIMQPGGAVEVMLRYKEQGVIGHIGVAGGPIGLMIRYIESGAFEALLTHNRYTLLNRAAEPLLQLATQRRMAILNAAPYGGGILSRGPENFPRYAYREADDRTLQRARQMMAVCGEYNVPLAAAALQFSMRGPRITSTVAGMTRPERLAQTLGLARHPILEEMWERLDAVGFDVEDL
ncbi:MAG TPA: aldo/keto reductase [Anaerolineales bacterium]|nr:aldo/keto reductase [Anaerolineales bacterium]